MGQNHLFAFKYLTKRAKTDGVLINKIQIWTKNFMGSIRFRFLLDSIPFLISDFG